MANTAISKYPLAKIKFAQMKKMEKHVFFCLNFSYPLPYFSAKIDGNGVFFFPKAFIYNTSIHEYSILKLLHYLYLFQFLTAQKTLELPFLFQNAPLYLLMY